MKDDKVPDLNLVRVARSAARRVRKSYASLRDRRLRFRDVSRIPAHQRRPATPLIQFYSSVDNIGNYTPVLGSQQMLGIQPDTWCVHRRPIDFDFINRHYEGIIVGGAGLLDPVFAPFWHELHQHARLPTIIWGVGGCWPQDRQMSSDDRRIVGEVGNRCDLINVRDSLTAEYFGFRSASIAPCPTIAWLEQFRSMARGRATLVADHHRLVPADDLASISSCVRSHTADSLWTRNIQEPRFGLMDILRKRYFRADRVVTTRLHGAIIAYGLGIPYTALSWDDKVRAFHAEWGGGELVDIDGLPDALSHPLERPDRVSEPYARVREFGEQALAWMRAVTAVEDPGGRMTTVEL
jgi:hypothetical protein